MRISKVILRDGTIVGFQIKKIRNAISKAFAAVLSGGDDECSEQKLQSLAIEVEDELTHLTELSEKVDLELIQDTVEKILMQRGYHAVAKQYVLYREKRRQERTTSGDEQDSDMFVIKRDGRTQLLSFDKIIGRIQNQAKHLNIDINLIIQRTVAGLYSNIATKHVDDYLAEVTSALVVEHPDYAVLAGRLKASSLHKNTDGFAVATEQLYKLNLLNEDYYAKTQAHLKEIEEIICYQRDYGYDFFALMTLIKAYLLRSDSKTVERPQDLWMRVALTVTGKEFNYERVKATYDMMSRGYYTHATPTLFNSGMKIQQLSSCFLVAMESDSIDGIFNSLKDCARISKTAGGIGIHAHNVRAAGSLIKSTNGRSNGLIPFLKIFNETARSVDQGGGKRKGSFAVYLEPWHADIETFLELRKNTGAEEFRARDLFYALWIPDLFMKRFANDELWTLMSEDDCPGLSSVYGEEFERLYTKYEREGKGRRKIAAKELMTKIASVQIETGQPYMLYKDAVNRKSNQQNIGVIKSSNLCAEIVEYSDKKETAVCNLASLSLPKFVKADKSFDFEGLQETTRVAIANLDEVIDCNFYPTDKAKRSNLSHRPVGLGVQGLADVFFKLDISFDSASAKELNRNIFEAIYFAALDQSCQLAATKGAYKSYQGSPSSQGILQFDLWKVTPSLLYDWSGLRARIKQFGLRNSLVTACMPTASTSILFRNIEAIQPQTSNIYKRQTLSGEFVIVNHYLVKILDKLGLWNATVRDRILLANGSLQDLDEIPDHIKAVYRTVWEISQRVIIDLAADRGPFVDQSQSMNLWLAQPTVGKVSAMHLYSWRKGLKTGMYYLRSRPAADAFKVSVSREKINKIEDDRACEQCSC